MKCASFLFFCLTLVSRSQITVSPITSGEGSENLARLENDRLRVAFVKVTRGDRPSVRPEVQTRTASGWTAAAVDASAESYQILSATAGVTMEVGVNSVSPRWFDKSSENQAATRVMWDAGTNHEAIVATAEQLDANRLKLRFHPTPVGTLEAIWKLSPGDHSIQVSLSFIPASDGQFSLGYFLFNQKPIAQADELLMPMLVSGKRFPSKEYTLLSAQCPTPLSLMQVGGLSWAVSGDPASTPFEFPVPARSRYGLHIRNTKGNVQPSIYGPLIGTPNAQAKKDEAIEFNFRVLVQPGDWYAGYRTVADEVFGWKDYRTNGDTSLTQAALNMIDLYMDDDHGGWWKRAKAPYQVESKNGSTLSSPMTAVSLYYLTGDSDLYQRRTLPTLEFLLSRDGPHFSPIPEDTGGYAKGSMNGPVNIFGGAVYGGLWEMTNRRTPAFHEIAFPKDDIRMTTTQQAFDTHNQSFDEWLGRYLFTGDKAALERAVREADAYIAANIDTPPSRELSIVQFFLMAYTPAWEGLLRMYEVTKEQRFLDAAAKGARAVMTGMWTQPTPEPGDVTIHPGDFAHGDKLHMKLHKGTDEYRLGWPRKAGDTPERKAPAWQVSNVGLGFEQPTTYTYKENGGRMIFQAPWTGGFLRLAQYTGDKQFETYARNATLGRWGNYPGYYYTTFTDVMKSPRYPYDGPDLSFVYYHHIPVHLSWTLDYLVSQASLRSEGEISFPALRQFGYAYFDNLVYGHAPGEVLGVKDAWLWLRKDLVTLDNPQINYLMAHTKDRFFVVLMNESSKLEELNLTFHPKSISKGPQDFKTASVRSDGGADIPLTGNSASLTMPPRGLKVIEVSGLSIDVPAHRVHPAPKVSEHSGFVKVSSGDAGVEVRAASIQIEPGAWQAYVWSTAASRSLKEITLAWKTADDSGTITDTDYPYEFSVPVPAGAAGFQFETRGTKADGTAFSTPEMSIGVED